MVPLPYPLCIQEVECNPLVPRDLIVEALMARLADKEGYKQTINESIPYDERVALLFVLEFCSLCLLLLPFYCVRLESRIVRCTFLHGMVLV